ncbi:MAG: hypothetical protein L5655_06055 [Thermosediminibacteraceae bacterium]|nr:hypothetical protein [Thermosediminibacteraceae bacterium]
MKKKYREFLRSVNLTDPMLVKDEQEYAGDVMEEGNARDSENIMTSFLRRFKY